MNWHVIIAVVVFLLVMEFRRQLMAFVFLVVLSLCYVFIYLPQRMWERIRWKR